MEIKDKIIKVSYDLFLKYGLRRVSIDDICSEIRISKKTFYANFKQKEDLVSTILYLMRMKLRDQKKSYPEHYNAIDKLISEYKIHQMNKTEKHVDFFFDLQKYYPEIYSKHDEMIKSKAIEDITHFIEKGIEEKYFREDINPRAIAILIHMKFPHTFMELKTQANLRVNEAFEVLYDALIHMVANESGLKYYKELRNRA